MVCPPTLKCGCLQSDREARTPHVRALPPAELRALGRQIGLVETAFASSFVPPIPLEAVLKTSFPNPGDLEKVRALYLGDAQSGWTHWA